MLSNGMGIVERKAREKEELRQRILDAAGELIVKEGYENLSMRKLAERIEYSPSTIYLYFKDKYEILASICIDVFDRLSARLEEIHRNEPNPLAGLRQGMRCYIDFGLSHPSHYLVTFSKPYLPYVQENSEASLRTMQSGLRCFGCLREAVVKSIAAGMVRNESPDLIGQSVWTCIHGLTSALITMGDDPHFPWVEREQLIENTVDTILRGIQPFAVHEKIS